MKVLSKLDMSNNSIENARFELVPTIPNGVEDNIVKIGASGALVDSGVSISEVGGGGGDMSNYYTKTEVDAALDEKQDVIADLADIRSGAALGATALQEHQDISGKQDVLVSGTNIKTINNQSLLGEGNITIEGGGGDMSNYYTKAEVNTALGNKQDVLQYSTMPTATEELFNSRKIVQYIGDDDNNYTYGYYYIVSLSVPVNGVGDIRYSWIPFNPYENDYVTFNDLDDYVQSSSLATVATSGDYEDLQNTPNLSEVVTFTDLGDYVTFNDLSDYAQSSTLATVATSGDYGDLINTPDLSDFVTESHVYEMGFATNDDIADFITADYLSNEGYVTNSDISSFVTESDVAEYLSNEGYMTQSEVADYLSNEAYVTESFLSDTGYVTEEFLSTNDYLNTSNLGDAIGVYLSDFITGDVLVKYVTEIDAKPNYATVEITDTDTQGSYTYTIDTSSLNIGEAPIVQVTYNGQVLFTDITITIDSSNSEIVVTWDDTKYSVDSNNPLTVVIIGQAPAQQ